MKKLGIVFLCLIVSALHLRADTVPDIHPDFLLTNRAVTIGIGSQHEYDSYLSPLLYKGTSVTVMSERLKYFSLNSDKLSWYGEGVIQAGIAGNPAGNASMIPFSFRYFWGVHYHFRPVKNMSILTGGLCNMDLGGRLHTRNQNNPFSLNWNANFWISAIGYYHINLKSRTLTIREHFAMPFVGLMFSPHYTQTYYDIFGLGQTDDIIDVTSFSNRLAWRNKLTIDLPVSFCTFRVGMLAERTVTNMNELETRSTNLSLIVGWVYSFSSFRGKKEIPQEFHNPIK